MKLSKHSKDRMKQRANIKSTKLQERFFKNALLKGLTADQIENEEIKKFLKAREKYNCKVKLYKNWVFIYSKNNKQLYTLYELPKEIKEGL